MDDAIAIALKRRPDVVFRLRRAAGRASRRSWPPAARGSRARAASSCSRMCHVDHARAVSLRESSCRARSGPTPKSSASVWPRSANVAARAEIDARRARAAPATSSGTYSRAVIGARRRRIVAVVGGDDEQVVVAAAAAAAARAARRSARGSPRSPSTSLRWPYCVSKSTRFAKIKPRSTVRHLPLDLVHAVVVARRVNARVDAAAREQVLDLADGDDRQPTRPSAIEQRLAGRRQRVVVPVRGPREARPARRRTAARSRGRRRALRRRARRRSRRRDTAPARHDRLRARRSETRCRPTCRRSARRCACARRRARR